MNGMILGIHQDEEKKPLRRRGYCHPLMVYQVSQDRGLGRHKRGNGAADRVDLLSGSGDNLTGVARKLTLWLHPLSRRKQNQEVRKTHGIPNPA